MTTALAIVGGIAGLAVVLVVVSLLARRVAAKVTAGHRRYSIDLPTSDGAGAAWLHAHGEVLDQHGDDDNTTFDVRMGEGDYARFTRRFASEAAAEPPSSPRP